MLRREAITESRGAKILTRLGPPPSPSFVKIIFLGREINTWEEIDFDG
jgi:hypothetical protein